MNYYMVSQRYENFLQLQEHNFEIIGFPAKSKIVESVKPGDKLVLYIGSQKSLIPGIVEATSECYWDNKILWDDIYPKNVNTKIDIMLKEDNYVSMKLVKNGLSFIDPSVKKFGVYLMKGLRKLSEEDYNYILEKVKEKDER